MEPYVANVTSGQRIALAATGGSGAMASLVGAARAFEEAGLRPALISLCSGSALFAFPWRPGSVPRKWRPSPSLLPQDYIDVDWLQLPRLAPTLGRGLGGIMRGDAIEEAYRRLLGDMTLGDLPMPAYPPIWNVEQNRVEFQGDDTSGWEYRRASILYVASQVRTLPAIELARESLARLRAVSNLLVIEPVPYEKVQGVSFYRQFLSTRDWPGFMEAGRSEARRALAAN